MNVIRRRGAAQMVGAAALASALVLTGCGTPGAPLPPSLKLPDPVSDLSATRTGDQVTLTWTMPRKTTDKLLLTGNVPVRVCRKEVSGLCAQVQGEVSFAPNTHGSFNETLPPDLSAGLPRLLTYVVELRNAKGRSAGPSNAAVVLAGAAPGPLNDLAAEMRKDGVVLRWTPELRPGESTPSIPAATTVIRLQRRLLDPEPGGKPEAGAASQPGFLAAHSEPVARSLVVEPPTDTGAAVDEAMDKTVQFGHSYEYRAQRVALALVDNQALELAGPLSDPVRVEAQDIFPPSIPSGLAAVATLAEGGPSSGPSIDLSWQPVTDADVAGYIVYRGESGGAWERISPAQPVVGAGFHDANVQQGHTYRYSVSAVDRGGRESPRSPQTEETIPGP